MSASPPNQLLSPNNYELSRLPRRPVANASSARSRSAPGSRNDTSLGQQSSSLNTHQDPLDSSSQTTAISTRAIKATTDSHVATAPQVNRVNTNSRIDSNPSSDALREDNIEDWDETAVIVPRTNLTVLDVAALILNKQIGTGIFTTPGAVLFSTGSKSLSVGLWAIGGLWTTLFLLVYLEFGNALPFNGGELVYLDEIYRRPELLATILFSGFFLALSNSYGNSIQFAKHVLIAAMPQLSRTSELDDRLVRYLAVSVVTLVCLIHWHSSRAGLFLNKLVAWYKTILLLVIFIAGMVYSGKKNNSQWNDSGDRGTTDGMAGMVLIFYSYQGWENANYVAGEIRALEGRTPKRTLNIGAFLGVITVWALYVMVAVALYRVLGYATLTGPNSDLAVALEFAPKVFGASTAFKICMAMSAFGNVLAVTYTAAKVKQSIAIQRILPFWKYLQRDENTPKGALFLHWVTSIIFIAAAPTHSDGYSFAIGLFTYGHIIASTLVALGLPYLRSRMRSHTPNYRLNFFHFKPLLYVLLIIFVPGNILILIFAGKTTGQDKIPRWWWPATMACLLFGSFLYWAAMQILMIRMSMVNESTGELKTIGDCIGLKVKVYHLDTEDMPSKVRNSMVEAFAAKVDGSHRRVQVKASGRLASWGVWYDTTMDWLGKYLF